MAKEAKTEAYPPGFLTQKHKTIPRGKLFFPFASFVFFCSDPSVHADRPPIEDGVIADV